MFPSEHVPCLAEMHEESALRAAPWNLDEFGWGATEKKPTSWLHVLAWPSITMASSSLPAGRSFAKHCQIIQTLQGSHLLGPTPKDSQSAA